MVENARPIQIGDPLPAVQVRTAWGERVDLRTWRGRPLLLVCVRYYG
jgi:hypothetical protein